MGASKEETNPLFSVNNCWRCDVPLGKLDFNSDECVKVTITGKI